MLDAAPANARLFDEDLAIRVCREFDALVSDRGTWESHWQEIGDRIWPMVSRSFNPYWLSTPGEKRNDMVFDSTAALALTRFGAILDSLLTPSTGSAWHGLRASNPSLNKIRRVQLWFEEVNRLLMFYRYAPKANFTGQNQIVYKNLGAFGTGAMFIDSLRGGQGLRYKAMFLGEIYFQENDQGQVDRAFRRFKMSIRQAYQKWGDALPKEIIELGKKDANKEIEFIHLVEPRQNIDPVRLDYKGMAFASYYVSVDFKKLIKEEGYSSFPYIVTRYEQGPGEVYGRGPAMDALPAIKTLNEQKKTILKQGHRAVDPVLLAHDDGVIDGFSMRPGAINGGGVNAEGRALVHALPVGNIAIGKDLMNDEQSLIKDFFLVSVFQLLRENPQMTATEVLEKTREKGILLAPTVGRQNTEYLGPTIEREIDVLARQRLLPPMPPELIEARGEYTVEYDSPITRTMRSEKAAGFFNTMQSVLPLVQATGDPTPLDFFDWDQIVPAVSEIQGIPVSWMRSKEQVLAMRQGRQLEKEQQAMVNAAPGAAAMMSAAAKIQK